MLNIPAVKQRLTDTGNEHMVQLLRENGLMEHGDLYDIENINALRGPGPEDVPVAQARASWSPLTGKAGTIRGASR